MTDHLVDPPPHRLWSVAQADAYLPALDRLFESVERSAAMGTAGRSAPGHPSRGGRRAVVEPSLLVAGMFAVLDEDGVIVRDVRRRLVDFRARAADGSVVLLCRVGDEDRIGWWHRVEDGFAGRRSLEQDPPW